MIHVATVHYGSDRWVDVQLGYLDRHLHEPYRVWANLEGVPAGHEAKFDTVVPASGPHAGKLNLLAAEIAAVAEPEDLIVFLDGDAFPVADPMPVVRRGLESTALVAVRRHENAGDPQPHPSFCAVAVHRWIELGGDWSPGHVWAGPDGSPTTDVGANLLAALERAGAAWTPLLRTNRTDVHPLWFGVYGGVVYHHGAGFRRPVGRADLARGPRPWPGQHMALLGPLVARANASRRARWRAQAAGEGSRLSDEMFASLQADPEFYRALVS